MMMIERNKAGRGASCILIALMALLAMAGLAQDTPQNLQRKMRLLDENEVRTVLSRAEEGNAVSQLWAGLIYDLGQHVTADHNTAARYYEKAAAQGSAPAAFLLAEMYGKGSAVEKDPAKAMRLYRQAADAEYAPAMTALASMYVDGAADKNVTEAFKLFTSAAKQGDPEAEYRLGMMYRDGQGTAKDCELAIKWIVAAANQKYAAAQTGVGDLYNSGTCVPQDYARAAKVYELAANQNDASAAAHLGALYADGHGVKRDPEAAYKWFLIAKAGGAARDQQEKLRSQLSPEQIASAEAAADAWIKAHQKK